MIEHPHVPYGVVAVPSVGMDPEAQAFQLIPLPGQLEAAALAGEEAIRDQLLELVGDAEQMTVLHGRP